MFYGVIDRVAFRPVKFDSRTIRKENDTLFLLIN